MKLAGPVTLYASLLRGLYAVEGEPARFLSELATPIKLTEEEGVLARFPAAILPSTEVLIPERILLKDLES